MATHHQGIMNKNKRVAAAALKPEPINYQGCYLFSKGEMRCRVAVFENCFETEFYADPDYSQHLDWNSPECRIFNGCNKVLILEIVSELKKHGWELTGGYMNDKRIAV